MIRIGAAFLCDAASIRDGLLFVLGGGITLIVRPSYPAPLDSTLAVVLYAALPVNEVTDYVLEGELRSVDTGEKVEIFKLEGNVVLGMPGEHASNVIIPLNPIGLAEPGNYALELRLDGGEPFAVPFTAVASAVVGLEEE